MSLKIGFYVIPICRKSNAEQYYIYILGFLYFFAYLKTSKPGYKPIFGFFIERVLTITSKSLNQNKKIIYHSIKLLTTQILE